MDTLSDRFIAWLLRSMASAIGAAGVALLIASVPLIGLADSSVMDALAAILLQIGGLFVVASATATYFVGSRTLRLPNERLTVTDHERPAIAGFLLVLAFVLVALPTWLVVRLQPFLAEWRRVIDFLSASGFWEVANSNMSGVVLIPLAGALTPPLLELVTLVGFVGASVVLVALLVAHSRRFPRFYVASVVLLSALVIASVRGSNAATLAVDAMRQFIVGSGVNAESASALGVLERYTTIVRSTAPLLVWTWFGYLMWIPPMFTSRRVRTTFAQPVAKPIPTPIKRAADLKSITAPPRFPMR